MKDKTTYSLETAPPLYFPFASGHYTTGPAMRVFGFDFGNGAADGRTFQIDAEFAKYRANKLACRSAPDRIDRYYARAAYDTPTQAALAAWIARRLAAEYPKVFYYSDASETDRHTLRSELTRETIHWNDAGELLRDACELRFEAVDLSDAILMQLPEDVALTQFDAARNDRQSMIHLCAPNHWAPADKIDRSFAAVHDVVPGAELEKLKDRYTDFLYGMVKRGPEHAYVRFAWGLAADDRLNHHPAPPPGTDATAWRGRNYAALIDVGAPLFVRVERQTLTGLPEIDALLFTIRTYHYDVRVLPADARAGLREAIATMDEASLRYKGLWEDREMVVGYL